MATRLATRIGLCLTMFYFTAPTLAAPIELLVPAYFYPSAGASPWDAMTAQAANGTPITAIMNPGSGPGTARNSDYVSAVDAFRAAGGKVLGYVPSGYDGAFPNSGSTCQPSSGATYTSADIVGCAQRYKDWYNVDGIFIDEYTNSATTDTLNFYRSLYTGIKGIDAGWRVMGNPGAATSQAYFTGSAGRTADTLVVFENNTGYGAYLPSAWNASVPASSLAHLIYNVSDAAVASSYVALAQSRNAGYIYVTNDNGANPWDTLPDYFASLSQAVRDANDTPLPLPSGFALGAIALAALGATRSGLMQKRRKLP